MIDLVKLNDYKEAFGFFARQLAYPEKRSMQNLTMDGDVPPPVAELLNAYREQMELLSMEEIEERYVQTFDFQRSTTLYMTYFKFEDSRERGNMLSALKAIYETFGLEMADSELPDYLPLMCEFLYAAEWVGQEKAELGVSTLLSVLEDGTYSLMNALEKIESPYFYLVKALRETFKCCLRKEALES